MPLLLSRQLLQLLADIDHVYKVGRLIISGGRLFCYIKIHQNFFLFYQSVAINSYLIVIYERCDVVYTAYFIIMTALPVIMTGSWLYETTLDQHPIV